MLGQDLASQKGWMRMHGSQGATALEPRQEKYWSRFAHSYDRDGEYIVGKPILQAIVKRLSEERDLGDCVELGCGTGYLTRAIAENARHIIATDLSDEMLEVARSQLGEFRNVTIQKADCANTGFPAERFDSLLMANLIHVLDDPLPCLRESCRILRNGGLLIVVDFTSYRLGLFRTAQLGLRYLRRWGMPPRQGQDNLSPEQLARVVESAGFRVKNAQFLQAESNALYLRGLKCAKPLST
jgi:ubiquinone/menaquinone biosynthesis C-methylase UbiE